MFTQYKKGDLKELIEGNHHLYNMMSLVGDKLRVIYTALGWTHMTENFSEPDNTVEQLTQMVLEELEKGKEEYSAATAGLKVEGYFEEDNLMLEYSFQL